MAVDFCDYFWGEKHDGFQVLMQNLKASLLASKELTEFVKEAAVIHEINTKAHAKMTKQLSSSLYYGTFTPVLTALKTSSEKLSQIHSNSLNKINDLLKDILKYSEELHKKQKQIKDDESATSDVVKSLQETSSLLAKQKEFYKVKVNELEKAKRENANGKDIEKIESKVKKAQEDYRGLVEKYSTVLEEFEKKMGTSCKHFQQAETLYLTQMIDFMQTYIENVDSSHNDIGQVNLDLEQQLVSNSVEKMLDNFVLSKYTGLVKPGPIEFNELTSIKSGGPPSDISDRSGNSDRVSVSSLPTKKESTGAVVEVTVEGPTEDGDTDLSLPPTRLDLKSPLPSTTDDNILQSPPPAAMGSDTTRSPYASLANWSVPGFLKSRKKKERSKKGKSKEEGGTETENKEIGSDGEERRRSETPTPDQTEDGYSEPPPDRANIATDPWADFQQPTNKRASYSSSDSDSDDEIKKIKVKIRPANSSGRSATSASVDELQKAIGSIDLTMSTLPKRTTPTVDFDTVGVKRSQSTNLVSKHSQDLLSLFTHHDTVSDVSGGPPGAESTRLDTSTNSNNSKEVSNILNDIHDLNIGNIESSGGAEASPTAAWPAPPMRPTSAWSASRPPSQPAPEPPSLGEVDQSEEMSPPTEPAPAPPTEVDPALPLDPAPALPSDPPPPLEAAPAPPPEISAPALPSAWTKSAWDDTSKKEETSWATEWAEPVLPALPPKQNSARPSSVQREKIASSLIPLPRPPSRARPERSRGTPSPTPTSILQSTALSLARSDSIGSSGSDRLSDRMGRSDSFASKFLEPLRPKSDSIGSRNDVESARNYRSGPLLPTPKSSDSPRLPPRGDSPSSHPPTGPAPTLNSFAVSRGPSPLTLGGAEVVPLAVAFQEVVHAAFRGRDETRCLVKQLGDMMLSFPAGIVAVLASNPYPAPLQFRIKNAGRLESVLPNKQLISKVKNLSTSETLVFEFNMNNLQDLLNKQSQSNPHASYFNIDILKYQITPHQGAASCPFQMVSYWKCEDNHTDLRLDFKYNQHAMAQPTPLLNLTLAVPVDGGVQNMTSQPKGAWNQESRRALWKFPDLSLNKNGGIGAIRARFQLGSGPGSQGTIAAQFNCEGTTLSGIEFELTGPAYRVSLVKRRFVSGKYVSEPDYATDTHRYAAPPPMAGEF